MPTPVTILRNSLCSLLTGSVMIMAGTTLASAADLRENISVTEGLVRVGDVFGGTGPKADTIIFEAPAPGKIKKLSTQTLLRSARDMGINWVPPKYLKHIQILREGQAFTSADLKSIILTEAANAGVPDDSDIVVYGRLKGIYLPMDASLSDVEVVSFALTNNGTGFTASLELPVSKNKSRSLNVNGKLQQTRYMPVLATAIAPGTVIAERHIVWKKFPTNRITSRAVQAQQGLLGLTVRRPIQAGKMILTSDTMKPIAIHKGSRITMVHQNGALNLSAVGRAMEDGSIGETIRLMNLSSKQMVEGRITGPGKIEVISNRLRLAAN